MSSAKTTEKKHVMIVGSRGQLGTELLAIAPDCVNILAVDLDELDITDLDAVRTMLHDFMPRQIINAAAYTAVDKAEQEYDKAHAVNCEGVANLATVAKEIDARVLHVSTDYVFNGQACRPYQPGDETSPLGAYGKTKLDGEEKLARILPNDHVIVRTAWLYSPHGNNFVKTMLRLMSERDELGIVADQIGTPTSAATLADVLWQMVDSPEATGVYHWTDNGAASWYDFACMIKRFGLELGLLNKNCTIRPITTEQFPTPTARPAYSVLDKSGICNLLQISGEHWTVPLIEVLKKLNIK